MGVLVVDNQRRIAQYVVAAIVQQRRDSHRHRRKQCDGREQRGETRAPEGADHKYRIQVNPKAQSPNPKPQPKA